MPAQQPQPTEVKISVELYTQLARMLEMVAVENARACVGPQETRTWHCNAEPILKSLADAGKASQNKPQATEKGK